MFAFVPIALQVTAFSVLSSVLLPFSICRVAKILSTVFSKRPLKTRHSSITQRRDPPVPSPRPQSIITTSSPPLCLPRELPEVPRLAPSNLLATSHTSRCSTSIALGQIADFGPQVPKHPPLQLIGPALEKKQLAVERDRERERHSSPSPPYLSFIVVGNPSSSSSAAQPRLRFGCKLRSAFLRPASPFEPTLYLNISTLYLRSYLNPLDFGTLSSTQAHPQPSKPQTCPASRASR